MQEENKVENTEAEDQIIDLDAPQEDPVEEKEEIEVVEETLDNDITRGGNALHTQMIEANTDEGVLFPYGGVRIVVRVLYEFTRGSS